MEIKDLLIPWYIEHKRDLVFRKHQDPYYIWVSEIMAQQTRIDTMLPYFERWIEKWPTIEALAQAPIEDVLKAWEGLGYYNRARKLHEGAQLVHEKYEDRLPKSLEELRKIPGIGFYTAGAIGSIAYGLRTPAVDGNVLRVISRLYKIDEDVTSKQTVDRIYQIVYDLMEDCNTSDFTQGLMEIGALVCTPKNPSCSLCPLVTKCLSEKDGTQMNYPIKKAAKKPKEIELHVYLIENENKILLTDECKDGLMKGLYRLPQFETIPEALKSAELKEKRKHVFSHRIWNMNCYKYTQAVSLENCFWVNINQIEDYPIVTAHKKWLKEVYNG